MMLSSTLRQRLFTLLFVSAASFVSMTHSVAADKNEGSGKAQYLQITPSIVTNFRADQFRYVKVDVALKVHASEDDYTTVQDHIPRIKHQLILMLSRQELDTLTSAEGRTALKEQALSEISNMLNDEGLNAQIDEVLFTGFLVE